MTRCCRWRQLAALAALGIALGGCSETSDNDPAPSTDGGTVPQPSLGNWGVETRFIDVKVVPGDDFYRFANGTWLNTTTIPPDLEAIDAFVSVRQRTDKRLEALMAAADNAATPGSPEQQIAALYASYLDTERRNALGISMLEDELNAIMHAETPAALAKLTGQPGFPTLFSISVDIDPGDPHGYLLTLAQAGLGLPDRSFYLDSGEPYESLRAAYRAYIADVFTRAGIDDADVRAAAVMDYETALATAQWTAAEQRDPERSYHPMSVEALNDYAPGFAWQAFLAGGGFGSVAEVNLETDGAIQAMAARVAETPLETQRAYLAFHHLDNHAELLSDDWVDAHFAFFGTQLNGTEQQQPVEALGAALVSEHLGDPVGQLYVARYFPAEAKAAIERLIVHLRGAFEEHLKTLTWMDAPTRAEALAKLDAFTVKVAYPERWHDYSKVEIAPDDLVGNIRRLARWERNDAIAKLGGPVRAWEWSMTPQTVNAYNDLTRNEIVFPAAILQPPFFDPAADPAVNFGAIGAVIGHEMSHGFDARGSHHDGTGKLHNWWSDASRRNFEARSQRLIEQFSSYSPLDGVHIDGQLTLNENIADLGGLSLTQTAYGRFAKVEHGGKPPVLDGYTGEQRLFLGYAQMWRMLMTDEALRQRLLDDPHSPGRYRTNGVVRNTDGWYDVWGVDADQALYLAPDARVRIW